ncbi:u-box domain-containing protein 4 [Nicotiana attenuata]|uniref:U-box domain-containing protein 4 n=1 Tax=Nicotiana attenuata TaxID=49451 RepID=A0A314KWA6_NICAT|nr:u-box domain-containing protein 4 [Nicotiana attenuata]
MKLYILKIKYVDYEMVSMTIAKVIKAQVEGLGTSSDSFAKIADCLSLNSNQELSIELVALEKLKENAEQAEKSEEVEYIEQMITLVSHMHDCFVTNKQSQSYSTQSSGSSRKSLISSTVSQKEESSPSHPRSSLRESSPRVGGNVLAFDVEMMRIKSEDQMTHSGEISSHGHSTLVADDQFPLGHN